MANNGDKSDFRIKNATRPLGCVAYFFIRFPASLGRASRCNVSHAPRAKRELYLLKKLHYTAQGLGMYELCHALRAWSYPSFISTISQTSTILTPLCYARRVCAAAAPPHIVQTYRNPIVKSASSSLSAALTAFEGQIPTPHAAGGISERKPFRKWNLVCICRGMAAFV